jgi:N-acetylglucosaminyl-diphospho-decaprenol L-rhamnosyltransferase
MPKLPSATIVIPNYNGERWLRPCLNSIFSMKYPGEFSVIVVDNNSHDGSEALIAQHFPQVIFYKVSYNSGFAHACNMGIEEAKSEYVVLLNNDTEVESSWLEALVERAESNKKIVAINGCTYLHSSRTENVPLVQNAGNIIFRSGYGRDQGALVEGYQQNYEPDNSFFQNAHVVSAFCGVNVLLRRSVILKAGGFRDSYFMYYEDAELSLRLRRMGYEIWYEPQAKIWHHHAASSGENSSFFTFYVERNRLFFLVEHFPWSVVCREFVLYGAQVLVSYVRFAKALLRGRKSDANSWITRALLRTKVYFYVLFFLPRSLYFRYHLDAQAQMEMRELYRTLY